MFFYDPYRLDWSEPNASDADTTSSIIFPPFQDSAPRAINDDLSFAKQETPSLQTACLSSQHDARTNPLQSNISLRHDTSLYQKDELPQHIVPTVDPMPSWILKVHVFSELSWELNTTAPDDTFICQMSVPQAMWTKSDASYVGFPAVLADGMTIW